MEHELLFWDIEMKDSASDMDGMSMAKQIGGIGLSNVKHETAKYFGNVDIRIKKNEFIVTALLQERSRNEQHNHKLHDKDVQ